MQRMVTGLAIFVAMIGAGMSAYANTVMVTLDQSCLSVGGVQMWFGNTVKTNVTASKQLDVAFFDSGCGAQGTGTQPSDTCEVDIYAMNTGNAVGTFFVRAINNDYSNGAYCTSNQNSSGVTVTPSCSVNNTSQPITAMTLFC